MRKIAALVALSAVVSSGVQSAVAAGSPTPQSNPGSQWGPVIISPAVVPKAQSAPVFFRPPDPGIPIDTSSQAAIVNINASSVNQISAPAFPAPQFSPTSGISPNITDTDTLPLQHRRGSIAPEMSRFQLPINHPIEVVCLTGSPTQQSAGNTTGGSLAPGNYLLRPAEDIAITTEYGKVKIAAKSCVLIAATSRGVSLYDFHDTHSGSVVWLNGNQQLKLLPGWQLSVTNDPAASLNEIDPCATIRHSKPEVHQVGNGLHTYLANFSIASALYLIKPLQHDEKLLKSAAIQHLISSAVRELP